MISNSNAWRPPAVRALVAAWALTAILGMASSAPAATPASSTPPISGVVNLNTASPEQLQLLPGVGEVRAGAIVARRKERGAFKKVDELLEVKGIGSSMLERMRPFLTLSGKTTARKL
jgi:competence protein ComEA